MKEYQINNTISQTPFESSVVVSIDGKTLYSGHGFILAIQEDLYHIEINKIGLFISKLAPKDSGLLDKGIYILRNNRNTDLYKFIALCGYSKVVSIEVAQNDTFVCVQQDGQIAKYWKDGSFMSYVSESQKIEDCVDSVLNEHEIIDSSKNTIVADDNTIVLEYHEMDVSSVSQVIELIKSRDSNSIITLTKIPSSRRFQELLGTIKEVIISLNIEEYFYLTEILVKNDVNRFIRSIDISDYHKNHDLSSYLDKLNDLVPFLFSAKKCEHSYNIVYPYLNILSEKSINIIIDKAKQINNYYHLVDLSTRISPNDLENRVNWLYNLKTHAAIIASLIIIDRNKDLMTQNEVDKLLSIYQGKLYHNNFKSLINGGNINTGYDDIYNELRSRLIKSKTKKVKENISKKILDQEITTARCKVMRKTLHHYILLTENSYLRALLPLKRLNSEVQYDKYDFVECTIVHIFRQKNVLIVSDNSSDKKKLLMQETLLKVGDKIDIKFCLRGTNMIGFIIGSNIYKLVKIHVENIPTRNFNYKLTYSGTVTRVNSFFDYNVKLL